MRHRLGPALRRAALPLLLLAACPALLPSAATAAPPAGFASGTPNAPLAVTQDSAIPFALRYHAVQNGGIVRAANSSITCRTPAAGTKLPCSSARLGIGDMDNGDYRMWYVDIDNDKNTYNSSSAEVRMPAGSRVSYARLYWGGNLLVSEQKPFKAAGQVLIAEPRGAYKTVRADTMIGHRIAEGVDAFQASADVTPLVRSVGSGQYRVAQVTTAMGHTAAGSWGGWTLVVAYENANEPRRQLALWDGFTRFEPGSRTRTMTLARIRVEPHARGTAGVVAYNGDRGSSGDTLTVAAGAADPVPLTGAANPADNVLNSTIGDPAGAPALRRVPAYRNTLGYDSDVLDLSPALTPGGDRLTARLTSRHDAAWFGAFFLAADAPRGRTPR